MILYNEIDALVLPNGFAMMVFDLKLQAMPQELIVEDGVAIAAAKHVIERGVEDNFTTRCHLVGEAVQKHGFTIEGVRYVMYCERPNSREFQNGFPEPKSVK